MHGVTMKFDHICTNSLTAKRICTQ